MLYPRPDKLEVGDRVTSLGVIGFATILEIYEKKSLVIDSYGEEKVVTSATLIFSPSAEVIEKRKDFFRLNNDENKKPGARLRCEDGGSKIYVPKIISGSDRHRKGFN